jgi:hypothetical protein
MSKETRSTAVVVAPFWVKATERSRTDRRGVVSLMVCLT